MRQQINLYQPILSEERRLFSAGTVGATFLVITVALIAIAIHANLRVRRIEQEVELLRAQQAQQQAMLARSGELQAAQVRPAELEARVKRLTAAVGERERALQVLQSGAAGQTTGFASRLEALARRHVEGLWLDHLVLSGANGGMSLAGATLNPDIVPVYLHSLARETVLSGTRFDEFVIERPDANPDANPDATPEPRKTPAQHVRFRAGNRELTGLAAAAIPPETAT